MSFTGVGAHPALSIASGKLMRTGGGDGQDAARPKAMSLSPRQRDLDRRWAYYRCEQYQSRRVAWDGSRVVGQTEMDSISLAGYVPPGFYVANNETLPIQFRKPTTPYHLCKVIVDRFTGLLFGQKRHPRIIVEGDDVTEDYINTLAEEARLWPAMMQARTFGGATGTAVIGFKVLNGRPQFEVFDPRWCTPTFLDRANMILDSLEYRYTFKQEIQDPESGDWIEADFWYRRVIDRHQDVVFEPVLVQPTQRVNTIDWHPASEAAHGLGFCPVTWIQNSPNLTSVDGDSDCQGVYELVEAMDRLISQSEKGVLANCDPTAVISTDAQMGELRKGSANAIKLPSGGNASYMEMTGSGIMQARETVLQYKAMALEVAQCVLEQHDGAEKTATEVERNFAAMLARADTFREQYGEMGVKRLINMALVAAVTLSRPRVANGQITRFEIKLPAKADGSPHKLGHGPFQATLAWPPYFEPSISDAMNAVNAAVNAKAGNLVDQETATKFIAPFFQIEDVAKAAKSASDSAGASQREVEQMALDGAEPDAVPDGGEGKQADTALNGAQVTALADLVKSVAANELPAAAAIEIVMLGFPMERATAERMINSAVKKDAAAVVEAPAEPPPVVDAPPQEEPPQ